jgi:hypothetical protein
MVIWLYGYMAALLNCYIAKLLSFNGTLKLNYLTKAIQQQFNSLIV